MPAKQYFVHLSEDERAILLGLLQHGVHRARVLTRARVLLLADEGRADTAIAAVLHIARQTVERLRQRYADGGLDRALYDPPRPGAARRLAPTQEAFLVALACSDPPTGRERWTHQLLADELIALEQVPAISADTVGRTLKTRRSSPG